MNSVVFVALLAVAALTVQGRQVPPGEKLDWLCHPCIWTFNEVEKYLPEMDLLTEELLDAAINYVCEKIPIPFIDHVCIKLGDEVVHDLYEFILTLDHYDSTAVCKHLDMC